MPATVELHANKYVKIDSSRTALIDCGVDGTRQELREYEVAIHKADSSADGSQKGSRLIVKILVNLLAGLHRKAAQNLSCHSASSRMPNCGIVGW